MQACLLHPSPRYVMFFLKLSHQATATVCPTFAQRATQHMFLPCATGALNTSGWVNLGMDECSSPCTVTSYDLWNKNKWRLSLCSSSAFTDIRTLVIILVPNIDKSENRMPWQGYNLPGNYLHQVPRRWGNKCRQIRSACHWQRMSPSIVV